MMQLDFFTVWGAIIMPHKKAVELDPQLPCPMCRGCATNDERKYTGVVVAQTSTSPAPYAELLPKVFDLMGRGLSTPLAESILSLDFPESDARRATELNEKANDGLLTEAERDELQVYAKVADLLAYWQSKARQASQHTS